MSTKSVIGVLIFTVAVSWAGLSARQSQTVPGPGTGIATVEGTVKIGNTVPVSQAGQWNVDVANTPKVIVGPPDFLNRGTYTITWAGGEREVVTITAVGVGLWVRADSPNQRPRWINTALVRSIEETR
jgi:hypothetical protein